MSVSTWLGVDAVDRVILRLKNCSLATICALADFCQMYSSFLWAGEY